MKNLKALVSVFFLALLFLTTSAKAQITTGRLTGVVKDASGALLPSVKVTITNEQTGTRYVIQTDAEGMYVATFLPPSEYDVSVFATGFSTYEVRNVTVAVGQEVVHNFVMYPAGTTTEVTVDAGSTAVLDTSSATIGANVANREIQNLPINGRQISQLYLLVPGATNSGAGTFDNIRFSGRAVEQNIIRLDGIEATSLIDSSPGNLNGELTSLFRLQQSLEAVQEFRVDSSSYPAEMGTEPAGRSLSLPGLAPIACTDRCSITSGTTILTRATRSTLARPAIQSFALTSSAAPSAAHSRRTGCFSSQTMKGCVRSGLLRMGKRR
jgi:hypothetical protein